MDFDLYAAVTLECSVFYRLMLLVKSQHPLSCPPVGPNCSRGNCCHKPISVLPGGTRNQSRLSHHVFENSMKKLKVHVIKVSIVTAKQGKLIIH